MNKLCFYTIIALLYLNIFFSCAHVNIPQSDKELAKGFLDGSGLKIYLNLSSCEREFYDFLEELIDVCDSLSKNDNKSEIFKDIGSSFILYSNLMNRCIGTKQKLDEIINYIKKAFNSPQKFLVGVMDNAVSFHVIKLYWGLTEKVKQGKFYEVGSIIGDMIKYIVNVNFERSELRFLGEINLDNEMTELHFGCQNMIWQFINEIYSESKNILIGSKRGEIFSMEKLNENTDRIVNIISKLRISCTKMLFVDVYNLKIDVDSISFN